MEGDLFLLGSQFMTSMTTLISKLFVPYYANRWSPSWAINSSPKVNFSCVWGVCCHPHWVLCCCKQAAHTITATDFSAPRVSSHNMCWLHWEQLQGWLRNWAELPKAPFSACPHSKTALPTRRRAGKAPSSAEAGMPWESLLLSGGSLASLRCACSLHFGVQISVLAKGRKENHLLLHPDPCS